MLAVYPVDHAERGGISHAANFDISRVESWMHSDEPQGLAMVNLECCLAIFTDSVIYVRIICVSRMYMIQPTCAHSGQH